jgi:ribosomal protein S18 acetylase RimI-like enzyme
MKVNSDMTPTADITIEVIPIKKLTNSHQQGIKHLGEVCFGHVDKVAINEHFFAKGFAWVLALQNNKVVGLLELHRRKRVFDKSKFLLGGIGGVCVLPDLRQHGIGRQLMLKGLEVLREEGCDVVCLNVDLEEPMYSFYEKLGFKMMEREISFTDIHGKRIHDSGTMFMPLNSVEVYSHIMNSRKTFHYGNGYW